MRTRYRELYLLLTAAVISAVLLLVSAGRSVEREKSAAAAKAAAMTERAPVRFVLGLYGDRLALYREGSERPYQVLDTEAWLLPDDDRAALAQGIVVDTEAELRALLEDLTA